MPEKISGHSPNIIYQNYQNSSELFESAIHILCSSGSHISRLKRAYIVISEVNPLVDLPKQLASHFYDLQYRLNKNYSCASSPNLIDSIRSLNDLELSLVTSSFILIYTELQTHLHPELNNLSLRQS